MIKEKDQEFGELVEKTKEQKVQLKRAKEIMSIPRHHLQHLKEHGALDVFIDAQLSGDDKLAKWHLLQAGKNDIQKIEKEQYV